ncbi:MAG: phosphoribosylamine--glycine ligase [Candidatus Latescibacterota bacterium]
MKVLVVGKGGREHALVWKIAQSARVGKLYAAPGNPGIGQLAECVDIRVDTPAAQPERLRTEIYRLAGFVEREGVDLTVVGPEDVLSTGIVDRFEERGLRVFGPTAAAARLESDKAFAKQVMASAGVPTAGHRVFGASAPALAWIEAQGTPMVVKATGLAAGKGVSVCRTLDEVRAALRTIFDDRVFGQAGDQVVVEDYMQGEEASLFAVTDGRDFATLVTAQDHKPVFDGDQGPNTGGMGAYAPAPVMTPALVRRTEDEVVRPTLREMERRGIPFRGVLYCGLMIDESGPRVVEFNCRFGDPETQVVLPLLQTDLVDLLEAAGDGRLGQLEVRSAPGAAVCVVMASGGYPGSYATGQEIRGLEALAGWRDAVAFHAGTAVKGGRTVTAGGRVLGITAFAGDVGRAVERAYAAVACISFDQAHYRRDIAHRALARG